MEGKKEILQQIGNKIRSLREGKNWSQVDLEVATGIVQADISRIESGQVDIGISKVIKIAAALDVQLNDLHTIK